MVYLLPGWVSTGMTGPLHGSCAFLVQPILLKRSVLIARSLVPFSPLQLPYSEGIHLRGSWLDWRPASFSPWNSGLRFNWSGPPKN